MRVRYDICFVFANRDKLPAILKSGLHLSFLRWLDTVFSSEYLPRLSVNYVAINKDLEKLTSQSY